MKCPCEECLLLACCKHKTIYEIYTCDPLMDYLGTTQEANQATIQQHIENFPIFYKILKPSAWTYRKWNKDNSKYKMSYEIIKRV